MTTTPATASIFSSRYLWITIGSCALVFLGAFENLAVTTIMPIVSADLHGASLYAIAFAGPLAVGVIGMVVAGNWSDRSGPTAPLLVSAGLFALGLLVAGTASTMAVLVAGRLIQGLGSGAITVALYVLAARIYPADALPRLFAGFAAAWVVPSLVGPSLAGIVTQLTSWHWVFLGVVGLVVIATVLMIPAFRMLRSRDRESRSQAGEPEAWAIGRILWAALAAVAVLGVNVSAELPGPLAYIVPVAAVVVALVAIRPLVPPATLTAGRGLPAVILLRGLVSAAFLGAEVYLPYLLIDRHHLSPTVAGLALTGGAIAWASTSWLQGHLGERLTELAVMRWGTVLVLAATLAAFATAAFDLSVVVAILGWVVGGAGMGLMYPRLSVAMLRYSPPENQGFNSAALTISDSLGAALSLALTGIVFAALTGLGGGWSFAGCFLFAAVVAIVAVVLGPRIVPRLNRS